MLFEVRCAEDEDRAAVNLQAQLLRSKDRGRSSTVDGIGGLWEAYRCCVVAFVLSARPLRLNLGLRNQSLQERNSLAINIHNRLLDETAFHTSFCCLDFSASASRHYHPKSSAGALQSRYRASESVTAALWTTRLPPTLQVLEFPGWSAE